MCCTPVAPMYQSRTWRSVEDYFGVCMPSAFAALSLAVKHFSTPAFVRTLLLKPHEHIRHTSPSSLTLRIQPRSSPSGSAPSSVEASPAASVWYTKTYSTSRRLSPGTARSVPDSRTKSKGQENKWRRQRTEGRRCGVLAGAQLLRRNDVLLLKNKPFSTCDKTKNFLSRDLISLIPHMS